MDSASEEELGATFMSEGYLEENDGDDSQDGEDYEKSTGTLREQDRFLPIANVARLMKKAIPKSGKIAKDARECVQECVSEFVSFITSEASERCTTEKRKTINGEDILFAMSSLGFDNYVEPLKIYLQKYRETMKGDGKQLDGSQGVGFLSGSEDDAGGEQAGDSNDTNTNANTTNTNNISYFENSDEQILDVKPLTSSDQDIF